MRDLGLSADEIWEKCCGIAGARYDGAEVIHLKMNGLWRGLGRGVCLVAGVVACVVGESALAGPVTANWPVVGPDDSAAVAAAALSGWYAVADSYEDNVEIRDVNRALVRVISKAEIQALLPWMSLDGSPDGPDSLAFSDSGRLLFIGVHDANAASDGFPSDAVLRYDTLTNSLSVFARVELSALDGPWPHPGMVFFKGRLYLGTTGSVRVYRAGMNDVVGVPLFASTTTAGAMVTGLTVDRDLGQVYACWNGQVWRSTISGNSLTWTGVGAIANAREVAYGSHYGGAANAGLSVLASTSVPASSSVWFVSPAQARGQATFAPVSYLTSGVEWHDVAATADGALLIGADEDAVLVTDSSDTRLGFDAWKADEFAQVVKFGKGLISPDGEPAGWVIDGDVQVGGTRFHPATPDAACWVVLLLLMNDHVNGDASAQGLVGQILTRYAGLMPDGIGPTRTSDGIFRHWIDPATGGPKGTWDPECATLSTMKIVIAAARARQYYPGDPVIRAAADAIICGISSWDAYHVPGGDAMYFKGLGSGGPVTSSAAGAFHEGILFVEQMAVYGGVSSVTAYSHWLDRSRWLTATLVTGRPITSTAANLFESSFISLYPLLVSSDYRASSAWRTQVLNLRLSNAAWTDDNGPRYSTVFSAGTTKSVWGGYHADSLGDHPGDVTTFTSLLALTAGNGDGVPSTAEAVGAYEAYRRGARQTFLTGASILYRRSNVDQAYSPDSAGMPDVALGALGLADLLMPGSVGAVLTGTYPSCTPCAADFDGDGFVTGEDFDAFVAAFEAGSASADFDGDGFVTGEDFDAFVLAFEVGC